MEQPLIGKKVALLAANGVEELHFTEAQRGLMAAGATVKVISPEQGLVNSWHGAGWGHYFPADEAIGDVLAADYDMLLVPGGSRHAEKLKGNAHTRRILNSFVDGRRPVALISEAVGLLALAEHAKGVRVAGHADARADLEEAGMVVSEEPSVIEGTILSGDAGEDVAAFVATIIEFYATAGDLDAAA